VVGDVHGCAAELHDLLRHLGYTRTPSGSRHHPQGRMAVFVGDLADRGPRNASALRTAVAMVQGGDALWVPGNHDVQLQRHLEGADVPLLYGLDGTVEDLGRESPQFTADLLSCLQGLPGHVVLDQGRLVVAHTGLPEALHGQASETIRHLAAYGVAPGEPDAGDPAERHRWVRTYTGEAAVAHGHTPVRRAQWRRNTIDIDTGCVYGGRLTALRWPERELVSIPARRTYAAPPGYF
jgi:protein phosphatase